jgi:amino-acid N-acetyltransferase
MKGTQEPCIRPAQAADMTAVIALLESAGLPTADLTSAQRLRLWVLEERASLVGVIGLERYGADALLRSLAVVPGDRNRGFGEELVLRVERDARAAGVERLVLLTETAEPFFRKLGYSVVERRSLNSEVQQSAEFRSLCPVSAVCMTKFVSSSQTG